MKRKYHHISDDGSDVYSVSSCNADRLPSGRPPARQLAACPPAGCLPCPCSFMFAAAPSSLLSLVQPSPPPLILTTFLYLQKNLWTVTTLSPSAERNLIGSLVGKPARLTTGYTVSLSKHALQLIYITLPYNITADPRPTLIAHRGRGRRPACSPAAHSARQRFACFILTVSHTFLTWFPS